MSFGDNKEFNCTVIPRGKFVEAMSEDGQAVSKSPNLLKERVLAITYTADKMSTTGVLEVLEQKKVQGFDGEPVRIGDLKLGEVNQQEGDHVQRTSYYRTNVDLNAAVSAFGIVGAKTLERLNQQTRSVYIPAETTPRKGLA